MTERRLRVCLVASEFLGAYKNGGIGTATTHLALLLARAGHAVHVVYTGAAPIDYGNVWPKRCEAAGIVLTNIDPRSHEIYPIWLRESCVVFNYLRNFEHDVILFQDWEGVAFSSMIAVGFPTMLLRPTTTACLPTISTSARRSTSIMPAGVHGTSPGRPASSRPALTG